MTYVNYKERVPSKPKYCSYIAATLLQCYNIAALLLQYSVFAVLAAYL